LIISDEVIQAQSGIELPARGFFIKKQIDLQT